MGAADYEWNLALQEKMGQGLGHGEVGQAKVGQFNCLRIDRAHHIAHNDQIRLRV